MADGFTLSDLEEGVVTPDVQPTPEPTPEVTQQEEEPAVGFSLKDLGVEPVVTKTPSLTQEPTTSFKVSDLEQPSDFTLEGDDRFVNVFDAFEKYDNQPLTKEDIVSDPDLMEVVYQSLEARFPETATLGKVAKATTGLAGGATGGSALMNRNYRAMDPERAFETWQNYQRSFDAAQSVTVANEIAFTLGVDDDAKKRLAGGYLLFNQMDSAITGEGSWGEMFDAIRDYTVSTVWDPTTLLSFGAGKALSYAGTRASGKALQRMMTAAYADAVKKGATKQAATIAVGTAVAKATPMAAVDGALAFGQDLGRQMQLIEVGAQEEYSKAEAALTAAGAMVFPVLAGGSTLIKEARKSGVARNTIFSYQNIDKMIKKHTPKKAWEKIGQALNKNGLFKSLDDQFGMLTAKGKINFLPWEESKEDAARLIAEKGAQRRDFGANSAFMKFFWFGDPDNGVKGYFEALEAAGFVMHPKVLKEAGNITNAYSRTIRFINPSKLNKMVDTWEQETGYVLDGVRTEKGNVSPVALEAVMKNSMSLAGENLWIASELSRLRKAGVSSRKMIEQYKRVQPSEGPKHNQAALSLYKRLITSHLSTTGANLQGFKTLVSLNTAADMVTGAIDVTRGTVFKALGNEEKAEEFLNRAYGEWGGAFRRMTDAISPDIPVEYADAILDMNPDVAEKLFRDIAGDGGVNDSLAMFNLDGATYKKRLKEAGKAGKVALRGQQLLWQGADAYTKGVQTLTLARLQDNLTKRFAFGTNLNQNIMKKYGKTPEEFFSDPNAEFKMAKPEFRELMEQAAYRTMRETASVNWSSLPATNFMRKSARFIETVTNRSLGGYVVPFGSFLNTTIATAGDLSGVNYLRHVTSKTIGKQLDPVTEDGAELLAKMVVGWSAVGYGVGGQVGFEGERSDSALERIESGLSWKQDGQADGTIRNREFEWPISLIRATSQAIGHGMIETDTKDLSMKEIGQRILTDSDFRQRFMGAIPDDLWVDLTVQVGPGQALRDLDDLGNSMGRSWQMAKEGDYGPLAYSLIAASGSKVVSGFTRHADPINTAYGMFNNAEMNPDLRQGNRFFNDAGRYLNQLTGQAGDMERRATPTRGFASGRDIDVGKQLMVRSSKEPNLVESMFNSAGANVFTQVRWDGPAKVKNYMDGLLAPALKIQAERALAKYPDYFEMRQDQKEIVLGEVREGAKKMVIDQMETGGQVPQTMDIVRRLSGKKKITEKVLDLLPFEFSSTATYDQKMEQILDMEDGYQQLLKIKGLVDTYDDWNKVVQ